MLNLDNWDCNVHRINPNGIVLLRVRTIYRKPSRATQLPLTMNIFLTISTKF